MISFMFCFVKSLAKLVEFFYIVVIIEKQVSIKYIYETFGYFIRRRIYIVENFLVL